MTFAAPNPPDPSPELRVMRKDAARIKRRYAILEKRLGRPLPEMILAANLLVDCAEAECRCRIREAVMKGTGGPHRMSVGKVFSVSAHRRHRSPLNFPKVRSVVRSWRTGAPPSNTPHEELARPRRGDLREVGSARTSLSFYESAAKAARRKGATFFLSSVRVKTAGAHRRRLIEMGIPAVRISNHPGRSGSHAVGEGNKRRRSGRSARDLPRETAPPAAVRLFDFKVSR